MKQNKNQTKSNPSFISRLKQDFALKERSGSKQVLQHKKIGSNNDQHYVDLLKNSALISGATTKGSCIIGSIIGNQNQGNQSSLKGTIIGNNNESLFSLASRQTRNERVQCKPRTSQLNQVFKTAHTLCVKIGSGPGENQALLQESVSHKRVVTEDDEVTTEKKRFVSKCNPHKLKRRDQLRSGYVWLAVYDEDMENTSFLSKLRHCHESTQPLEFQSLRVDHYDTLFSDQHYFYLQKQYNQSSLVKVFMISFQQVLQFSVLKNSFHMCEVLEQEQLVIQASGDQKLYELYIPQTSQPLFLDAILNIGHYDGIPILALTNKEKSCINGRQSSVYLKNPSFLKHMEGEVNLNKEDLERVRAYFKGLVESFPQFSIEYLLFYLNQRGGINKVISMEELTSVRKSGEMERLKTEEAIKEESEYLESQNEYQHSLFKNKNVQSRFNQNSNVSSTQKMGVQLSLTKHDIEDPLLSKKARFNQDKSSLQCSSSQQKGLQVLSITKSPNAFSGNGQGQVFVVNRQEEDFIKKIDFKFESQMLNPYEQQEDRNEINLNISNLLGTQQHSVNQSMNILQAHSMNATTFRDCNESESMINVPISINMVPFHQRHPQHQTQLSSQTHCSNTHSSSSQNRLNGAIRVPLKDIKNKVMNSILNQKTSFNSRLEEQKKGKGQNSGMSSQNLSPIRSKKSGGQGQPYNDDNSSQLQVEEYSNISDISYGEGYFQDRKKIRIKNEHFLNRKIIGAEIEESELKKKNSQIPTTGGSLIIGQPKTKGNAIFRSNNKENVYQRGKLGLSRSGQEKVYQSKTSSSSSQHFLNRNKDSATTFNFKQAHAGKENKIGTKKSEQSPTIVDKGQKTETFVNEIKCLLEGMQK